MRSNPQLLQATIPKLNSYIPHKPTVKQAAGLLLNNVLEVFYGGAGGGGKSDFLLMAALQFVEVPNYSAILFRRTYADLALSGALMDRAEEWLSGTDAHWRGDTKTWYFPSGATLAFAYMATDKDRLRYKSAEFQFIGFDELTEFAEAQYRYLFTRLRRLKGSNVPLRVRSASNPPEDFGDHWVRRRMMRERAKHGIIFIPAKLEDNQHIDQEAYKRSLNEVDPFTRAIILHGDWTVRKKGNMFQRDWIKIIRPEEVPPITELNLARFWDFAATETKPNEDPDYTAGLLLGEKDGLFYILSVIRTRRKALGVRELVQHTAHSDMTYARRKVKTYIEQEGGASGKIVIDDYVREHLKGYPAYGRKPKAAKELRAVPVSSAAEAGNVMMIEADWNTYFLDELSSFPLGAHDDMVDALSGAFNELNAKRESKIR